jgi:hypothetical protein
MKTILALTGCLATVLTGAGLAWAQTYATPSNELAAGSAGYYYPSNGYGLGGYHASTAEEGYLAGLGYLTRSQGEANYFNSLALINGQEAYNRYLQNREKRTETYFRMQQINRAAREAQRPVRLSFERYVALARQQAPGALGEREYDRTIGRLNWPALLQAEEFASERELLDRAYLARTPADSGAASAFHGTVWQLTQAMETKLKEKAGVVSWAEYMASKKFLQSLSYETLQPFVVRAVAAK